MLLSVYLAVKVDWKVIADGFSGVHPIEYLISIGFAVAVSCSLAGKYLILIKDSIIARSYGELLKINFISRFYALFLPSAAGREAARWYQVTKNRTGRSFFFFTIVYERMASLFFILGFGILPFFIQPDYPESIEALIPRLWPLFIPMMGTVLFVLILYTFRMPGIRLKKILKKIFPVNAVETIMQKFPDGRVSVNTFFLMMLLSMASQVLFIARLYFLFRAMDLPLSLFEAAWIASITLVLQIFPISFAGLGVREGALAYIFVLLNLSPEKGVVVGILFFSQMLILAGVGWVLNVLETEN